MLYLQFALKTDHQSISRIEHLRMHVSSGNTVGTRKHKRYIIVVHDPKNCMESEHYMDTADYISVMLQSENVIGPRPDLRTTVTLIREIYKFSIKRFTEEQKL